MKILIIEDESLVAKDLRAHLARLEPGAEIVGVLPSVEQSLQWFAGNALPDLILSDIQLSDGTSFEIFEKLHVTSPIIFTTAYNEYAIRAFKLNSIDYLLKPIDGRELEKALRKYKSLTSGELLAEQLKSLMTSWGRESRHYKERFLAVQRNAMVPVVVDDIAFFHKEELIFIHKLSNERLIGEHATLDEIEQLIDPRKFFRVNRQYIIHLQCVDRVRSTHKGLTVHLKPPFNLELDISREKATAFKEWLG